MKHTEYIIPIGEDAEDYDEMFIGVIRRQPELIRCKDCKYKPTCEEYIITQQEDAYCSWAERKEECSR